MTPDKSCFFPAEGRAGLLAVLLAGALLVGCSQPTPQSAEEYLRLGNDAMTDEVYNIAIENYEKLLEEYPFSAYTEEAQLKIAEALLLDKRYPEAIAAFEDFQRMYPTSPNLPFTEYSIALAYEEQMETPDRDQSAAANAHAHFRTVIDRYPESAYATKARTKLAECRESLAEHELLVAKFYMHWDNPPGAEARLRHLLQNFIDTRTAGEGLFEFGREFRERGDLTRAALAFASLIELQPESPRLAEARDELERLEARNVTVPEAPFQALLDTLGHHDGGEVTGPVEVPPPADVPPSIQDYS